MAGDFWNPTEKFWSSRQSHNQILNKRSDHAHTFYIVACPMLYNFCRQGDWTIGGFYHGKSGGEILKK